MLLCPQLLFVLGLMALGNVHASPSAELQLERGNCPVFWFSFNGRCFKYMPAPLTWSDAEKNCQSNGAHLASIHSEKEHDFVLTLIQSYDPSLQANWIGLHDHFFEGGWMWSDGSAVNYTNWRSASKEPNGGTGQNCVITYGQNLWYDDPCSVKRSSVCVLRTDMCPCVIQLTDLY